MVFKKYNVTVNQTYKGHPIHQSTGGSQSIRRSYEMLRMAGAEARERLKQAAADDLGVNISSLNTDNGYVINGNQKISYGSLVEKAATVTLTAEPKLKSPDEYKVIGTDQPQKVAGDIAIGAPESRFCLSEVKLGLLPATIGPYVIRAIGQRQSRRYFLTAELIDAETALSMNILHQIDPQPKEAVNRMVDHLINNGPQAMQAAKALCLRCDNQPIDHSLIEYTSQAIAAARVSAEGQEGLTAFFEKRAAHWRNHV